MEEEQKKVSGAAALPKVGWKGMLALAFGILFFAGVFATVQGAEWLKAFDYSTLIGKFGTMKDPAKATFVGMGGVSARGGFIFALSLIPSVMLAIGVVDVLDHYGALSAAQKLMTPLFKPLMDVPGLVGLALITDLQSTDAGAAGITARMERELDARILTPYFTSHFWWMGNGEEPMCNWTSWCTQNVLLTVFLLPTTQQQRKAAVKQAAYSLDCFLKDYGADGCCNEGAQYYRHAGLTLWGCLEILSNVAPEAFRPLFRETKIKNIAEYICNVHVEGPYYLNFGDCSPLAGRCGAREYRFGQAVGSDALQALAAADFRADADPDHLQNPDGSTHINLWYRLTTAFAEEEMMTYSAAPRHHLTVWYPSVGVYAARQGSWVLGAKFGSNGDSHNHNDTGSITVYKDGRPFLIDIGVESYTKKTFSPQRYEIWTMQSAWHNLPTFDGVQQLPGAEYAAREVCTEENSITGELAGAYPPIPGLTTYRRSVSVSEQGITLRDETDYPGTVDLTLLTEQQPVPTADGFAVGILGGIRFDPGAVTAAVTPVPITDPRLRTAWPETIYKITLHFQKMLNLELY